MSPLSGFRILHVWLKFGSFSFVSKIKMEENDISIQSFRNTLSPAHFENSNFFDANLDIMTQRMEKVE